MIFTQTGGDDIPIVIFLWVNVKNQVISSELKINTKYRDDILHCDIALKQGCKN